MNERKISKTIKGAMMRNTIAQNKLKSEIDSIKFSADKHCLAEKKIRKWKSEVQNIAPPIRIEDCGNKSCRSPGSPLAQSQSLGLNKSTLSPTGETNLVVRPRSSSTELPRIDTRSHGARSKVCTDACIVLH